ncbi:glycosyltransferase [Marinospirillum celere]|nr:glycosyltransferase [Marinospirillum celere]
MVNSASFNTLTKINFFPHDGVQPYSFLTNSDFRNTKYKVSVVIPGYKNSSSVLRLLESLNRQHFASFEVIVVSDGCEEIIDSTKNYIAQYPLSIYNTGYKQGFGVMLARNLGAQKSQGKLLVFIDPDVILPENFIYNIWKNYSDDTLIIPKVHFVDEFDHDKIILEEDRKGFRNPNSPILGFATQCCAISKLSFINLGGFDEALLGQGGSDSDFGLRHASIYNNAKFLNSIICFHIGLSSGKKYRVGEESKWDRTVYNSRKKSDFYKFPENAVVNDGVNYFYLNKWNEFKNLKSNIVDVDFILATVISDNENYGYLNYLKPSAEYYNIPLKTLYADEQAISRKTGSLSEKDRLLNMVLDNVSDNSIVMFVDGYDTVLLAGKDEIINNFNSYNSPLVVSAEINCHPDSSLASEFPESQYDARFLNTGGFIGYAWAIKKMIKKAQQIEVPDDPKLKLSNQYRWIRVYLDKKDKISLDLSSKLFLSASTKKEARQYDKYSEKRIKKLYLNPDFAKEEMSRIFNLMEIKGKRVKAKNSGSMPCVLHWNGPASVFMQTQSKSFSFLRPWE